MTKKTCTFSSFSKRDGKKKEIIIVALSGCISTSREICGSRAICCWEKFSIGGYLPCPFFLRRMPGRWLIMEKPGHLYFSFFFRRTFYNGFNPFIPLARADCESAPVSRGCAGACRVCFRRCVYHSSCPSLASSRGSSNGAFHGVIHIYRGFWIIPRFQRREKRSRDLQRAYAENAIRHGGAARRVKRINRDVFANLPPPIAVRISFPRSAYRLVRNSSRKHDLVTSLSFSRDFMI